MGGKGEEVSFLGFEVIDLWRRDRENAQKRTLKEREN